MAAKLNPKQQARLSWLDTLPPKLDKLHRSIEQMASHRADETMVKASIRLLGELKSQASTLGVTTLGEGFGYMESLFRRGGGHQIKVRGLREMLAGVKINIEGELRSAKTPEREADAAHEGPTSP